MTILKKKIGQELLLNYLKEGIELVSDWMDLGISRGTRRFLGLGKFYKEYYPYAVNNAVEKLKRKGFVKVSESKDGYKVELTEKGKTEVLKFNLNTLELRIPDKWDGRWRMVFFDILEKHKRARDYLCRKLKEMNFYQIQESVFIHPFPCDKEIKFLREVLGIPHEVKMGVLDEVENESDLKRIFAPILSQIKR